MTNNVALVLFESVFQNEDDFQACVRKASRIADCIDDVALQPFWVLVSNPNHTEAEIDRFLKAQPGCREWAGTLGAIEHLLSHSLNGLVEGMALTDAAAKFLIVCKTIEASLILHKARKGA